MIATIQMKKTIKITLAVVFAICLSMELHFQRPFWSGITAMIVTLPYVGATLQKAIRRAAGTFLGVLAAVLTVAFFEQTQGLFVLTVMAIGFCCGYCFSRSYTYQLVLFTYVIVIFPSMLEPNNAWDFGMWRFADVMVGIFVSLMVNTFLWPMNAGDELKRTIEKTIEELNQCFESLMRFVITGEPRGTDETQKQHDLRDVFRPMNELLAFATKEGIPRNGQANYAILILGLQSFLFSLEQLHSQLEPRWSRGYVDRYRDELGDLAAAVSKEMKQLAEAVRKDGTRHGFAGESAKALGNLLDKSDVIRKKGIPLQHTVEETSLMLALSSTLTDLVGEVEALAESIEKIHVPWGGILDHQVPGRTPQFQFDPTRAKLGLQVAVGLGIALYGWWAIRWTSGIEEMVSFALVMAAPHIGGIAWKSFTRLLGNLVGAAIAIFSIIFVLPGLDSIYSRSIVLFVALFPCYYVHTRGTRYAYAGFQAALCYLLVAASDNSGDISLGPAVSRTVAVFIGNLIAAFATRFIFPIIPGRELSREMSRVFRLFRRAVPGMKFTPTSRQESERIFRELQKEMYNIRLWLDGANFYDKSEKENLKMIIETLHEIGFEMMALHKLHRRSQDNVLVERFEPILKDLNRKLKRAFLDWQRVYRDKQFTDFACAFDKCLSRLAAERQKMRDDQTHLHYPVTEVSQAVSLEVVYRNVVRKIEICQERIHRTNFHDWNFDVRV